MIVIYQNCIELLYFINVDQNKYKNNLLFYFQRFLIWKTNKILNKVIKENIMLALNFSKSFLVLSQKDLKGFIKTFANYRN